jgi:hypothetical protein
MKNPSSPAGANSPDHHPLAAETLALFPDSEVRSTRPAARTARLFVHHPAPSPLNAPIVPVVPVAPAPSTEDHGAVSRPAKPSSYQRHLRSLKLKKRARFVFEGPQLLKERLRRLALERDCSNRNVAVEAMEVGLKSMERSRSRRQEDSR